MVVMAYVFLDESGDLGFSKKSSKWFLFTIAIVSDSKQLEKVIKKVWGHLKKKHKGLGELHATHEKNVTRKRVLKMISEIKDLKILCTVLDKKKVHVDLQNQKHYLYTYTANVVLQNFYDKNIVNKDEPIHLFVDRKDTRKKLREDFVHHLTEKVKGKHEGKFSVILHSSHENKSLQAVDFISWAIFRKYEQSDYEFYEIIKNKIIAAMATVLYCRLR
jgi:hypothetical protein